jgi:predicted TIM-barrel fold metal-dependent hydrolase
MPAGLFGQVGTLTGLTRVARENILVRWQEDIAKLASCPNIYTKISGLLCLY